MKTNMEIIKIHYTPSKAVTDFSEIKSEAEEIKKMIEAGKFRGVHKTCYAIHHAQVSWHPYNFFVVSAKYVLGDNSLFNDRVIINPKIIKGIPVKKPDFKTLGWPDTQKDHEAYHKVPLEKLEFEMQEGCMSFPFREAKKVTRFAQIEVEYQNEKMQLVRKVLVDTAAHVFQHETDHGLGKNIFFKS